MSWPPLTLTVAPVMYEAWSEDRNRTIPASSEGCAIRPSGTIFRKLCRASSEEPSVIKVDSERAQYWLGVGAQPTEQVLAILKLTGDWGRFKGDKDAVSTVKYAEGKAPFEVDAAKKSVIKPKAEKKAEEPAPVEAEAADEAAESTEA